ncbi:hypothetical protein RHGRI_003396 [Rhododendron griersonianum]|uniref:Uncharacterized protein n=1 Tax=Rhododendron griersonianum TaxID=479676 RepID=A0AAV6L5V2_9ERIC|nr:hypothetical protein RHGRI_003396 [Rhododendron griersonianum]
MENEQNVASPPRLLFLWAFLRKAKPETEPSSVDIVVSASPLCYSCSLGMKSYYSSGFLSLSVFKTSALPSSSFAPAKLSPASASHQRSSLSEIMVVAGKFFSWVGFDWWIVGFSSNFWEWVSICGN